MLGDKGGIPKDADHIAPPPPEGLTEKDWITKALAVCPNCEAHSFVTIWNNGDITWVTACDDFPAEPMTDAVKQIFMREDKIVQALLTELATGGRNHRVMDIIERWHRDMKNRPEWL